MINIKRHNRNKRKLSNGPGKSNPQQIRRGGKKRNKNMRPKLADALNLLSKR
jgi:hypothetical protein